MELLAEQMEGLDTFLAQKARIEQEQMFVDWLMEPIRAYERGEMETTTIEALKTRYTNR